MTGALVASHRPGNPVGWFLCATPAFIALSGLGEALYWSAAQADPRAPGARELGLWIADVAGLPAFLLVLVFLPLLFPTGGPPSARWRVLLWLALAMSALRLVDAAFHDGTLYGYPWVENPLGVPGWPALLDGVGTVLWAGTTLAAVASLLARFRRSHGAERQQLKWFTAAAAQLVVLFLVAAALVPVLGADAGWAFFDLGLLGVAVAVALAVLRHRLYDIDLVVNRALVYGALTIALGAAYLATVLLLQLALRPLTSQSQVAVAGSTLAVAALFRPARAWIQRGVDRRFFRSRYDAAQTLDRLGARVRREVELDALSTELCSVVAEALQPAHVSLWLRETRRWRPQRSSPPTSDGAAAPRPQTSSTTVIASMSSSGSSQPPLSWCTAPRANGPTAASA